MNKKLILNIILISNLFGNLIIHEQIQSTPYGLPLAIDAYIRVEESDIHRFSLLYRPYGNIEFIGRIDKQIKLAGRRIELGEIEYIIKRYGGLDEIVIVAKKDTNGVVEHLVAFTTNELSENEIISMQNKCDKYIESIFFPKIFIYQKNIPITLNGKIYRSLLEQKALEYST